MPTSETGIAMIGMIAARQLCRNTSTTSDDQDHGLEQGLLDRLDRRLDIFGGIVDDRYSSPAGSSFAAASSSAWTASAVDSALEPGSWVMAIATVGPAGQIGVDAVILRAELDPGDVAQAGDAAAVAAA